MIVDFAARTKMCQSNPKGELIAGLVCAFIGMTLLFSGAGIYSPTNHLFNYDDDYGAEMEAMFLTPAGGVLLLAALIVIPVALTRDTKLVSQFFGFKTKQNLVLWAIYFGSFAIVFLAAGLLVSSHLSSNPDYLAEMVTFILMMGVSFGLALLTLIWSRHSADPKPDTESGVYHAIEGGAEYT